MFKSMTMLAGAAAGIYMAVATGAPPPQALLSHLQGAGTLESILPGAASSCGNSWGTGSKSSSRPVGPSTARVTDVRTGQHACFDRLVIDLGPGAKPGYHIRYVGAVHAQGTGQTIPLRGKAQLDIVVADNAAASFPASKRELANVSGYRAFRQVAGAGSFEGSTEIGLGLRTRLPFHVQMLSGPGHDSRLVIDVAHQR